MAAVNECCTCRLSNKKSKSSVICTGCSGRFCQAHHREHRVLIERDFLSLTEQHNGLREQLFNEVDDKNSTKSTLLKKIDKWEKDMIKNIQATALASRTRLIQMMEEEKDQLKSRFSSMANELNANQSANDYVETDIQEWQKQLSDCKRKIEQLLVTNSDFIDIDIKPTDLEKTININRRHTVKIRTKFSRQKYSTCKKCGSSFIQSAINSDFCSVDCSETLNSARNQYPSSDDEGSDGCFHGECEVLLRNGLKKLVKDICPGDIVRTPDGIGAAVVYCIKIECTHSRASMVCFDSGLVITPWHPIRIGGIWTFPRDLGPEKQLDCREMYNFILDTCHMVVINGYECVTLGHNFKGDIIEHPYFGTHRVVEDLRAIDVRKTGLITLSPYTFIRNRETRLVSGIRMSKNDFQL